MDKLSSSEKRLKCFASVDMLDMSEVLQLILSKYFTNDEHKLADNGENSSKMDRRALYDLKVVKSLVL